MIDIEIAVLKLKFNILRNSRRFIRFLTRSDIALRWYTHRQQVPSSEVWYANEIDLILICYIKIR